jgi:hypothetical protein
LRAAPRRYRLPPLPDSVQAAEAASPDAALAFAIECARRAAPQAAPQDVASLFVRQLARLVREALSTDNGDAAFQALVLQAHDAQVREYVRLQAQRVADRRAVRSAIDAIAHPGKLRHLRDAADREALAHLHRLAAEESWHALWEALAAEPAADAPARAAFDALRAGEALRRLMRAEAMLPLEAVRRYRALCEQRGPQAGSAAAAAQGRAAARVGDAAEAATVQAFGEIAVLLARATGLPHRVLRNLRTPAGFPGEPGKAKDEWDVVLACDAGGGGISVVLVAEVKNAPAAATPDFARLQRGLQRLAGADPATAYAFACAEGEVRITGESLRALAPHGRALPPHAIYCCSAPVESQPQMLGAAARAVLLAEAPSLAFADRLQRGESPDAALLLPVWQDLAAAPRLRSVLHQHETAAAAREAMLHPADLLAAVRGATG